MGSSTFEALKMEKLKFSYLYYFWISHLQPVNRLTTCLTSGGACSPAWVRRKRSFSGFSTKSRNLSLLPDVQNISLASNQTYIFEYFLFYGGVDFSLTWIVFPENPGFVFQEPLAVLVAGSTRGVHNKQNILRPASSPVGSLVLVQLGGEN